MQNEGKASSKVWVKSIAFVAAFWSLTALFLVGLCHLFNAIDLTALIQHLLGA